MKPPAPMFVDPAYDRWRDQLLAWLNGARPSQAINLLKPLPMISFTDPAPAVMVDTPIDYHRIERRRAQGPAPYVGKPYCYRWDCAVNTVDGGIVAGGMTRIVTVDSGPLWEDWLDHGG